MALAEGVRQREGDRRRFLTGCETGSGECPDSGLPPDLKHLDLYSLSEKYRVAGGKFLLLPLVQVIEGAAT